MNCLVAVSIMALFAAAMGQADQPDKCCISRQFEGVLVQLGGYISEGQGHLIENYALLSYDYDAKILKISEIQVGGGSSDTTATVIDDYNSGKRYIIDTNDTCYISNVRTAMPQPCIIENATFIGRGVFGYGNNALQVNTWRFVDPSTGMDVRAALTEDCIPVMQVLMGTVNGVSTAVTYIFSNYKPNIADRSVFNLPAADTCKELPTSSPVGNPVGRRSLFF